MVANHPLGCVEGVILAELLLCVRSDVKILANQYLKLVPELASLFIGVDVFEALMPQKRIYMHFAKRISTLSKVGCY